MDNRKFENVWRGWSGGRQGGKTLEGGLNLRRAGSMSGWDGGRLRKWSRQTKERRKELASASSLKGLGFAEGQKLSPLERTDLSGSDRVCEERLRTEGGLESGVVLESQVQVGWSVR